LPPAGRARFSLAGDIDGHFKVWKTEPGARTVTPTPCSQKQGGGRKGLPLTRSFTIQP